MAKHSHGFVSFPGEDDEPLHAREWRWSVDFEISVNSRQPVMRVVMPLSRMPTMTVDLETAIQQFLDTARSCRLNSCLRQILFYNV